MSAICPFEECFFDELKEMIRYQELKKLEYFSRVEEPSTRFAFLVEGILRIYYLSERGVEHNKHFLFKNNFLAASINLHKKSITNIQALTATKLIWFDQELFISLLNKYNHTSFIHLVLENYLEEKQNREISLLSNNSKENYRKFLVDYPGLEKNIASYHIASYLGITPTQLSRIKK